MLKDVEWPKNRTYKTTGKNKPVEFFSQGLKNSKQFDLQLGYFNSAAISVLSNGFASFIANGGRMRMAINQIVSKKDKFAIQDGIEGTDLQPYDLADFEKLKKVLNEYGHHFFRCLAYLIHEKRIEIRIIKPKETQGIAHTKLGQFVDDDLTVSFSGSANFTLGGLFNNAEDIKICLSSSPDESIQQQIIDQCEDFERIMNCEDRTLEYLSSKELEIAIQSTYGDTEIDELINVEKSLYKIKKTLQLEEDDLKYNNLPPSFPYSSGPREYQTKAYENWEKNGMKGFFAMATGTGKTITSLNCLLNIYNDEGAYKCLILVPTIALVDQWRKECMKFHFSKIIRVSSKSDWKEALTAVTTSSFFNAKNLSYIVIATYASFAKKAIANRICDLPVNTLLIADEAHNMGSATLLNAMKLIPFKRRIGLSATPNRQYDDIGNNAINKFFHCEEGYTYEYSMKEAIRNGVLCHYRYFPHIVKLTEPEMEEYMELSVKIAHFYNSENDSFKDDPMLTALLLKRKRIIHKAVNKLWVFQNIIQQEFDEKGNLNYTMVYVPEGVCPHDYEFEDASVDDSEEMEEEASETTLIDLYTGIISNVNKYVTVEQFTSKDKNRNQILDRFECGSTQVLVAMKCLDEGVDVPRAETAIFCASTGNPRQFIQRRGRILRTSPQKAMAYIHDLVVVPFIDKEAGTYEMERSMLRRELMRVRDFAMLSTNLNYTEKELDNIIDYYKLNLYEDEQN